MATPELLTQIENHGFAVIPGFEVSTLDVAKSGLTNQMQELGESVSYFGQPLVMDVKPQPNYQPVSSGGTAYFDLHTDLTFQETPPELFGLLCVDSDKEGGDSLVADGYEVLNKMQDDLNDLRNTDVTFPTPAHIAGKSVVRRIVSGDPSSPTIRFRSDLALGAGAEASELIQRFSTVTRATMQVMHLSPGDLLVVDNHRILHGRTEITANPSKRHLLRMYASKNGAVPNKAIS
jgi:gamma-butyrobetaine dioxygenase